MADVFISHSTKDKETADKVVAYLEERGISCWIAPRDIVAGTDWAAAISAAITSAKIFLLIYSENSAASEQCAREMNLAETVRGVFVVPYKIDDHPLTGTYQYYLTGAHWIMADAGKGDHKLEELHLMVSGILVNGTQNNTYTDDIGIRNGSMATRNYAGAQRGRGRKFIVAGAVGAAAVTGIIVGAVFLFSGGGKPQQPVPATTTAQTAAGGDDGTAGSGTVSYGTLQNYMLTYNSVVIDGTYTGELNAEGRPEGKGEFEGTYKILNAVSSVSVTGDFRNGMLNGSVTFILTGADGGMEKHESDSVVDGKVMGTEKMTVAMADGTESVSEVEMLHGIANGKGKGTAKYPNGDTEEFEAVYSDGAMNGEGKSVYNYAESSDEHGLRTRTYIGNYKDNVRSGNGTLTLEYADGSKEVYDGGFANDDYYGKGTHIFTYPDSTNGDDLKKVISVGTFSNGSLNGTGKRTDEYVSGERRIYDGDFVGGRFEGSGTLTAEFAEDDPRSKCVYTGSFKDSYFEGKGRQVTEYKNGVTEITDGDWVKGQSHGSVYYECSYSEPMGDAGFIRETYSGYVKNNVRSGTGIQKLFLEGGTVISINGEWEESAPAEGCIVTEQDSEGSLVRTGVWKNGTIEWQQAG